MLKFGDLAVVEKTFTREPGAVRGQAYNGIKFRRYESKKGAKAAQEEGVSFTPFIEEQFIVSNKLWNTLGLVEFALTQANLPDGRVLILVVEDQDQEKPEAKFCRQSKNKDGSLADKGKMFSNEFLKNDLVKAGILPAEGLSNYYLKLTDVTSEFGEVPSVVKSIHLIEVDDTVDASKDEEAASTEDATAGF